MLWLPTETLYLPRQTRELINTVSPKQHGCHFADDIFKYLLLNEKFYTLFQISLKFVPEGPTDNVIIGSGNGWGPNSQQVITW